MEAVVTCASADDYCGSRTCFTGFGISSFETCCDIRKTAQGDHRCFQDATPWAGTPQCFSGGEHAYNRCCDTSVSATGGDSCWTDEITFETCCPDPRPTSCFYCCFQQEDSPALLALEAFTGEVACADDANSDTSAMPGTRQPRHAPSSALSRWEYTADEISTVVEACPVTCNTGPCAWFTAELSFDACCSVAADQRDPACFNYGAPSFGECCLVLPPAQLCTDSSFSGGSCTAGDDGRLTVFNAGGSCMGASCSQQECCIELPAPAPVPVLEPEPAQACTDNLCSAQMWAVALVTTRLCLCSPGASAAARRAFRPSAALLLKSAPTPPLLTTDSSCAAGADHGLAVFNADGTCSSTSCQQAECCTGQICDITCAANALIAFKDSGNGNGLTGTWLLGTDPCADS